MARVITPRRTADFTRSYLRLRTPSLVGCSWQERMHTEGSCVVGLRLCDSDVPLRDSSPRSPRCGLLLKASPLALPASAGQAPYA